MIGDYIQPNPLSISILWAADFNVWFDVDGESFPTDKQLVAWAGFCNINSNEIKEMMIDGLTKLVDKMDVLPNDVEPEFGRYIDLWRFREMPNALLRL